MSDQINITQLMQQKQQEKKTSATALVALGVLVLMVLGALVWAYWFLVVRPKTAYEPKPLTIFAYSREYGGAKVDVPLSEIFSPSLQKQYRNEGLGFSVTLTKKFKGKKDWEKVVKLDRWEVYEDPDSSRDARGKWLSDKRKLVADYAAALNSDDPRTWDAVLLIDGTSGTGAYMNDGINQAIGAFDLPTLLDRDDVIHLHTYLLQSSGAAETRDITLRKGDDPNTALASIKSWLTQPRTDEGNSSIATVLFNAMAEIQNPYAMASVLSDGAQNTPDTANFYSTNKKQLLDGKSDVKAWDNLWKMLQKQRECPDLSGRDIHWTFYLSPGMDDPMLFAGQGFWEHELRAKGGAVKSKVIKIDFARK